MTNQERIRNDARLLKQSSGVTYIEMAHAIGMKISSFYNFMSRKKVRLSSSKILMLENYIQRRKTE